MPGETTRRRGAALEADLLDAAWAELKAVGYTKLTMEGVAARARTGKQVLYRRWSNRAELVIAAMRHRTGSIADRVPDTGSLREDVLEVLRAGARRQREIGPDTLHGLLAEARDVDPSFFGIMRGVLRMLVERAAERGEIPTAELPRRVLTLPADLLRHEILLSREQVTDETLTEIVDDVFLPLVVRQRPAPPGETVRASERATAYRDC
ncbi:TetR/AcrR family transcriptional regulator [Streptomyces sp. NBC_00124]|uniref:TetR/AcrR family transcriptional regulator n=1 Tax=Streptomyces sp. NBC_00124 TaxID=2975662 RepID=UPI00224DD62D|nr:TetR/AcrR family transcriptional regulator [Streptomyces sp. NBC_00124]MCX5360701.1 TetR/AcrR family transcriptional regulator [Streptomyces sp. NBC_00124]